MKNLDKDRIKQIIATRKKANSFYQKNSNVYRSYLEMEQNTYKDGALSKQHKELIAIGISVVINCESCMEWHIKQALDDGVSQNEIIEAIEVGIEMSGGPGTASARFAMNVLDYYSKETNSH
ncbi:MAG TPA: carboxymuconolactone decarboxylase family protein [Sunxiuqinia sp.]|nr:carboxymuconolactone decarboxylase family protein [Sunxiuqinia sp.]